MNDRTRLRVTLFVICAVFVATWILATFTVGESLSKQGSTLIGFAIALLLGALAVYWLLLSRGAEKPDFRLGVVLIACGTLCILACVALQFYLVSTIAEGKRQLAELMSQGLKTNPSFNVNLTADYPHSVQPISYFALLAGVWLAAVGIKVGVARGNSSPKAAEAV